MEIFTFLFFNILILSVLIHTFKIPKVDSDRKYFFCKRTQISFNRKESYLTTIFKIQIFTIFGEKKFILESVFWIKIIFICIILKDKT